MGRVRSRARQAGLRPRRPLQAQLVPDGKQRGRLTRKAIWQIDKLGRGVPETGL